MFFAGRVVPPGSVITLKLALLRTATVVWLSKKNDLMYSTRWNMSGVIGAPISAGFQGV